MGLFLFIIFWSFVAVFMLAAVSARRQIEQERIPEHDQTEHRVADALESMDAKSYVLFNNLILESDRNTSHTEIDHVVVSPYGIFCIETKSHRGSIYGYKDVRKWKQYLGGNEYDFYNPIHQNYKHTKAIQNLLGSEIKVPIHSLVVFPNANKVVVDGTECDLSINGLVRLISNHTKQIYNLDECTQILKTLAYASTQKSELAEAHKQEVREFLTNRA